MATVLGWGALNAWAADRALLLDDPLDGWRARVQVIEAAEHTLDIEYYAVHAGSAAMNLIGILREAADRGVRIRILLDAMTNGLKGKHDGALGYLIDHPQVSLRLYNPFRVHRPPYGITGSMTRSYSRTLTT